MIPHVLEQDASHQERLEQERRIQAQLSQERREQRWRDQERLEREWQEQQERSNQARIREAGNRGTQLDLGKLLAHSQDNTPLISSENGRGLREKENQEPEDASNHDISPTQQTQENITGSTTPPQSTRNFTEIRIISKSGKAATGGTN